MLPNDKPAPLPKSAIAARVQRIRERLGLHDQPAGPRVPVRTFERKKPKDSCP